MVLLSLCCAVCSSWSVTVPFACRWAETPQARTACMDCRQPGSCQGCTQHAASRALQDTTLEEFSFLPP